MTSRAASLLDKLEAPKRYVGPKSSPAYQREWRKKNLGKARAHDAARRKKHAAYTKAWKRKHPEKAAAIERRRALRRYGLTIEDYDRLVITQANRCAICLQPQGRSRNNKSPLSRLDVDHCHASGKVRGLLCYNCNAILGHAKDSIAVLRAAIAYLEVANS